MQRLIVAIGAAVGLCAFAPAVSPRTASPEAEVQSGGAKSAKPAKPEDLDRLLAPVALYPDALLGQMLLAATTPAKIGALSEWLRSQNAKGTALQDAAKASGFDESCVALVLFPDVVNAMAERIDWTTQIGTAFSADRSAVFASIQRLRTRARDAGKLKDTPQQDVETKTTSSGQQVIVIEPANPQVVYVPQYNAQTVYTPTTTSTSSTVVIKEDDDSSEAVAAGLIGFTAGIAIGAAMDNNYYYGPYGWGGGMYMYNDAWDDWYDHREDAREDWMDHREDIAEERGERAGSAQEQRTERQQTRQENRPETQAQRDQRRADASARADSARSQAQSASPSATGTSTARSSAEARGYTGSGTRTTAERSGTRSDAFSGYSSGKGERSASSRGQRSRSSSRSGGSRRR